MGGQQWGGFTSSFGFYEGNNDDLLDNYLDRSVLRHVKGGHCDIESIVVSEANGSKDNPLMRMITRKTGECSADIYIKDGLDLVAQRRVGSIEYLSPDENDWYCGQTVSLQRLFNWLSKVPEGHILGETFVTLPHEERSWERLGRLTRDHLLQSGYRAQELDRWVTKLAQGMGYESAKQLPPEITQNSLYFCFFPSGYSLARKVLDGGVFSSTDSEAQFDKLNVIVRRHLFETALYKITPASDPIAHV